MDDIANVRPVDAFKIAQQAVDALHRMEYDSAFRTLGLDPAWLDDATLLEVVRIATARLNEYLARAGLPPAVMPPNPDDI
jgi:hypothetical protein